jgi:hypothetical protein
MTGEHGGVAGGREYEAKLAGLLEQELEATTDPVERQTLRGELIELYRGLASAGATSETASLEGSRTSNGNRDGDGASLSVAGAGDSAGALTTPASGSPSAEARTTGGDRPAALPLTDVGELRTLADDPDPGARVIAQNQLQLSSDHPLDWAGARLSRWWNQDQPEHVALASSSQIVKPDVPCGGGADTGQHAGRAAQLVECISEYQVEEPARETTDVSADMRIPQSNLTPSQRRLQARQALDDRPIRSQPGKQAPGEGALSQSRPTHARSVAATDIDAAPALTTGGWAVSGAALGLVGILLYEVGVIPMLALGISSVSLWSFDPTRHKHRWVSCVGLLLGGLGTFAYLFYYEHIG